MTPADIQKRIDLVASRTGHVPNIFSALAERSDELRAPMAHDDAVLESDSGPSKAEREMIVVATGAAWD